MTKGFKYRLRYEDKTLMITNTGIENGVTFVVASGTGDKYDLADLDIIAHFDLEDGEFVELVKRLSFEADKISNKVKKETPKTEVDFGEEKAEKPKKKVTGKKK